MKTAVEIAMEKADRLLEQALAPPVPLKDERPKSPTSEDEADIEYEGHKMFAVARRYIDQGESKEPEVLVERERLPVDVKKWQPDRARAYLIQVSKRLKKELDRRQGVAVRPTHVRISPKNVPGREMEDKVLRRNHANMQLAAKAFKREDPKVTIVLNARIAELQELVHETQQPEFYQQGPEQFGRANALREALSMMIGKQIEPLRLPEKWLGAGGPPVADVIPLERPAGDPPEDDAA